MKNMGKPFIQIEKTKNSPKIEGAAVWYESKETVILDFQTADKWICWDSTVWRSLDPHLGFSLREEGLQDQTYIFFSTLGEGWEIVGHSIHNYGVTVTLHKFTEKHFASKQLSTKDKTIKVKTISH